MVGKDDIETLLQTGSWRTSRSRSPNPYDSQRRAAYEPPRSNIGVPRTTQLLSHAKRPPPPSVEDEEEALAREHVGSIVSALSEDEPKHRGDIDQQPILLPVHEHNPERRFVIVPGAASEDAPKANQARYEANTCRKYVLVNSEEGTATAESDKDEKQKPDVSKLKPNIPQEKPDRPKERGDIPKRKSHQDLPRLTTDFEHTEPPVRRASSRRGREKPLVQQEAKDYASSRDRPSARPSDNAFLSPTVKHTAGRRERAYWDFKPGSGGLSGRSPSTRRNAGVEVSDGRRPHHSGSNYLTSPATHRRASSTNSVPVRDGPSSERPKSFIESYEHGNLEDISAYKEKVGPLPAEISGYHMAPGEDFMAGRHGREASPPRRKRNSNSPPHPRGARDMPAPSPNRKRQPRSATREPDGYSSDDSYKERHASRAGRPYSARSTLDPDYPSLLPPDQARQPNSRLAAPLPSPRTAQTAQFPDDSTHPSARNATFPAAKNAALGERRVSPSPPTSTFPSQRPATTNRSGQSGPRSRGTSVSSVSNGSVPLPPPVPNSFGRTDSAERRTLAGRVAPLVQQESSDIASPVPYWQPGRPDGKVNADKGPQNNVLARLPDCRWKGPSLARNSAISDQLLTLKRADNFTICPDCYRAVFVNTQFQNMFVPAPARSGNQLISCDFGSSAWYRIAYLMTLKHGYSDLRLLWRIAAVAAQSQPCAGNHLATRIWYSVMAPHSKFPIQTFSVCLACAKMVEVLLPNLAGVFVPLVSHEPARGVCELHFAPERKRFFEYFNLMEQTSDRAVSRVTPPDITELADRIRAISLRKECLRNTPIPNSRWHVLEQIPEFTVCEECFDAVVWPMIEDEENSSEVPQNFYKVPQPRSIAACQLYSDRMRQVFLEACNYDDFDYLRSCVLERLEVLVDVKARYHELQREDQEDPEVQEKLAALARQFKEVE